MTKVIIIDDDKDTVSVFSEYLELYNVEVIGKGYDGKQAVELFTELKPDAIFLDVMMDKYDGLYALEKIREIQPDAVVIMITADLTNDTANRLSELNASAIMYKPYDIKQVIYTMQKLIPISVMT